MQAVGFRKVIDELVAARIPLVGHNCLLDVLYLHHHFIAPLPPTYDQWKTDFHKLFPLYAYNCRLNECQSSGCL